MAVWFILRTVSRTYNQLRALFRRQPRRYLGRSFLCIFLLYFTVLLEQLRRLYIGGFIFQVPPVYNYSTCRTNRVPTRLVRQVRVYAFGALTTYLRVWCTYKALTNQGEIYQYIDYTVCFNTRDSYYYPKEYTILYVFRTPRHDLLILLNWYQHIIITNIGNPFILYLTLPCETNNNINFFFFSLIIVLEIILYIVIQLLHNTMVLAWRGVLYFQFYFLYISFIFYSSIKVITEAIYRWFYFSSTASV